MRLTAHPILSRIEVTDDRVIAHVIVGTRVDVVVDERITRAQRDHLIRKFGGRIHLEEIEVRIRVA